MALPKKLKHLNLFNDGNSYLGIAKAVTLPVLGRKLEAYRGGGMDGPVKVDSFRVVDTHAGQSVVEVVLHEGRKHIVRRMLKQAGYPVQRLVRTKFHTVQLGDMKPGSMRALNSSELASLYKAVGM